MSRERSTVTALLDDGLVHSRQVQGGTFLVIKGPDRDARVRLGDTPLSFGSGSQCSLVLNDTTVSRKHFEVTVVDGEILVTDCDSTNGIKIGNLRVERAAIGFGTEIRLGRSVIKFVPDEELVAPEPTEATAFGSIIGADLRMRQLFTLLEEVAATNATVLIEGETGTGKELIAEEIHRHSPRRNGPFVVFDCSTVPRELVASILFGHLKGSYTGATSDRRGIFAEAHGGTVFLDEIGEMELALQPALLRALDKRAVCRVGATVFEPFDVRVVAATHRELRAEIANKRFREDLYYRLAVIRVSVPPLRERGSDIPRLVAHFAEQLRPGVTIPPEEMKQLLKHDWRGNVRELRNVMERACVLARNNAINLDGAITDPAPASPAISTDLPFKEVKRQVVEAFEREYIEALLERHPNNLSAASREAQIDRKHMRDLTVKYGLASRGRALDGDDDED